MRIGRLTPFIATAMAIVLLLAGVVMILANERSYRTQKINEVAVQTEILAATITAALTFNDRDAANEYVGALKANPDVLEATIRNDAGTVFATYSRPARGGRGWFADETVRALRPVVHIDQTIGSAEIRAIMEPLRRRVIRYAAIAVLVVMTALVVGVLGVANAAVNRANRNLEATNADLRAQIEQREKAEDTLRQVQKMETLGQLTGGVAHDFNNLLTIILGNLERLLRRPEDVASVRKSAHAAAEGARRAAVLTKSLLAFSRRQPLDPKSIDLNSLVGQMSDLLRRTLGEQFTIETALAAGLHRVSADPNQLENALINLAINARDAGATRLVIETNNVNLDASYGRQQGYMVKPGDYVCIAVTDNGSGMTEEVRQRAFEPFFTTKDVGHGTGLGLSQVYGFVKQSGGHINLYSEVGRGTTARIYLPRQTGIELVEEVHQVDLRGGTETVLVVEDEQGVREHTVALLTELGYSVIEAGSGPEALSRLTDKVDLLFTDVGLPGGMNGRQLADEARRRHPRLRVLFTTGYARSAIIHEDRLDPGVHLVSKPFTFEQVAAALRRTLSDGPPTVLVVEDETLIRMTTVESLEAMGCRTIEAATAREAAAKLDDADVALIDLGLPDGRGDELADRLLGRSSHLRVIIASGYADQEVRQRFVRDTRVSFLDKPYEGRQLRAALTTAGLSLPKI